jgi:hypothetical protein
MRIPITKGLFIIVDAVDYPFVAPYKWTADVRKNNVYAYRQTEMKVYLHQYIMGSRRVDHVNGDGLDNRRSNLRVSSHAENMRNRKKREKSTSWFKGVSWDMERNKWRAVIQNKTLGRFKDEFSAALVYNYWAKKLFGPYALLNGVNHA